MSDKQASIPPDRFHAEANVQAHFAWLRTRLAAERTMMAYMRTAVSLIGFGFAIFQFFYRAQQAPEIADARFPMTCHEPGFDLHRAALARPFHGGGQQTTTDAAAALVGPNDEIVDFDDLVDAHAFERDQPGHQNRDGQNAQLALGHQQRRARRLKPRQDLLPAILPSIEKICQLFYVTRPCQPHADGEG